MIRDEYGPEASAEDRRHHHMQVMYARKTHERRVFMNELRHSRRKSDKKLFKQIVKLVGPKWYQTLSVSQREALDTLEASIYQDLLSGRPKRLANVMKALGLFPRPNKIDLMNCAYHGRNDPKVMLAELFLIHYGHGLDSKQDSYCLNAKLILSGIYYLGLSNIIKLLKERFKPEPQKKEPVAKKEPKKQPTLASPYLQKMVAFLYEKPKEKPFKPAPLPNLDDLNEPYEEEPPIRKPPPPPPPPPPPKKKLPRAYCDELAGIISVKPQSPAPSISMFHRKTATPTSTQRKRNSRLSLTEVKKSYGMGNVMKKPRRRKKPKAPSTGLSNSQYMINGVYTINGQKVFVIGNVTQSPPMGDLIHGGHTVINGDYINIHCGFKANPPAAEPDHCDCAKNWTDAAFNYVKKTKCYCGHYYDYGNEGKFPEDELPFFQKPTYNGPHGFNYETIYDLDPKSMQIKKEFQTFWNTDSTLRVNVDKKDKDKKKKRSSSTCLGEDPTPEDYLKCALRQMRRGNLAARLPDLHLAPELKEWMRRRIYGPLTLKEKKEMIFKSNILWQMLSVYITRGLGHVQPPWDPLYSGATTWRHKQELNDKFRKFTKRYKLRVFQSQAFVTNLFWPSMFQAQCRDKKFREIYFSYMFARIEDVHIMRPYSSGEAMLRSIYLQSRRYSCKPEGVEPSSQC